MSAAAAIIEDRRLRVLKSINEMGNRMLNEEVLLRVVVASGRATDFDTMRADLAFLEHAGCVRIEKMPRTPSTDMWLAHLTDAGVRAADGLQKIAGVAHGLMF
ncbi:hypothetical protein [Komagataeibacter xylinus]|uniref:hypothetical protein n=1 Tax=Komagataeibacter xylinus TaxID=28448 RepID=UPI00280C039C|nr:hypothetical protein [Komagataeibacter xylinus]